MDTGHSTGDSIDKAVTTVGLVWPVHLPVTANPLLGLEDMSFSEAVMQVVDLVGGHGYPSPETSEAALEGRQVDPAVLDVELANRGYNGGPEVLPEHMDAGVESADAGDDVETDAARVDRVLTKWLSTFLDEGQAHWSIPDREDGLYNASRSMAAYDGRTLDDGTVSNLPESPVEVIEVAVVSYPEGQWVSTFEEQFATLPGWIGFIKQRIADGGEW